VGRQRKIRRLVSDIQHGLSLSGEIPF
jgi:hypothetical protein